MRGFWAFAAIASVIIVISGCGGGNAASVEGTVTLDGQPLSRGTISFIPQSGGAGATATIRSDGRFAAQTGSAAGLQPGEYIVTVRARDEVIPDAHGGPPMPGKLLTPKKYDTASTSDLRASITPGGNELKLELRGDAS